MFVTDRCEFRFLTATGSRSRPTLTRSGSLYASLTPPQGRYAETSRFAGTDRNSRDRIRLAVSPVMGRTVDTIFERAVLNYPLFYNSCAIPACQETVSDRRKLLAETASHHP